MRTLLIGYGNPTRSDDGAGIVAAEEIEKESFEGLEVRTSQQLHVDLVEDFSGFKRIILIDASVSGPEVSLRRIKPSAEGTMASSHHLGPGLLLKLSEITKMGSPELYLCTVRGECFDFGDKLSEKVLKRVQTAVEKIKALIKENKKSHA